MKNENINLEHIRAKLYDRSVKAVSEATGINTVTISKIKNGRQKSCSKLVLLRLSEYFEARP